ncbi:MAG: hypothetical protein IKB73_06020 [Ruminococcus sp.]|nr:hypothetical protein [Ruminococcus sp.]
MKKSVLLVFVIIICLLLTSCVKTYNSIDDYQIIYDNVENANKTFSESGQKDTLLEFSEYSYCSYLLLFPRETPDSITDFEYYWSQGIDYDSYFTYFTYTLSEYNFNLFSKSISEFSVSYGNQTKKPVYTETLFEYPTYIMSWTNDVYDSGVCEYVMLDEDTHTVINVYKMFCELDEIQRIADFNIKPVDDDCRAVETLCGNENFNFAKHTGFSVYSFLDDNNQRFAPDLDELIYDDFLESVIVTSIA